MGRNKNDFLNTYRVLEQRKIRDTYHLQQQTNKCKSQLYKLHDYSFTNKSISYCMHTKDAGIIIHSLVT